MSHKKLQTETRAGQTDNPHRIYVEDWASDGDSTRLPAQSKPYEQMLTEVEEKWKRAAGAAIAGACSLSGAGSGGSSLSYPADVNCPAHWHRDEVPTAAYMLGVWPMGYSAWCSRGKLGKRRDNYMYGPLKRLRSRTEVSAHFASVFASSHANKPSRGGATSPNGGEHSKGKSSSARELTPSNATSSKQHTIRAPISATIRTGTRSRPTAHHSARQAPPERTSFGQASSRRSRTGTCRGCALSSAQNATARPPAPTRCGSCTGAPRTSGANC